MKKITFLLVTLFFTINSFSQSLESFETESSSATSFTSASKTFTIGNGNVEIFANSGVGSSDRFMSNNNVCGSQNTLNFSTSDGSDIYMHSLYVYSSTSCSGTPANTTQSALLKGFKDGGEVFSVTIDDTGGDVTWTNETSDGFTQVNLASLGHGNKLVDEIRLDFSGSTVAYAAFDEIVWSNSSVGDYNRENFETASDNASTFTNNSQSFTLTNSLKVQKNIGAIGVNESSGFLDNFDATPPIIADGGSPYSPSVQTTDGTDIFLRGLYVYMSNNGSYTPVHSVGITVKGYRDGSGTPVYSQVFSPTFDNDNKGFNFLDISDSNEVILIDRFEIVPANNTAGGANEIQYVAIDNLYWSLPSVTTPPTFENSTPSSSSVAQTSFTLGTDIDEAGTIYYVVVADGATAPSSTEVKAGTGSGGSGQVTSGNAAVSTGGFTNDFSVTSLTASTAYDVYVVAEDDEGTPNLQASPTKIDVTTSAPITLTITGLSGDNKEYDDTTAGSATGTASLSGISGGDVVTLGGSPVFTFASANVGTGITLNTTGYTISGTDAGKYTLTQPTLSANITAKELTITGITGDNKEYDDTTAGSATGTASLSGLEVGDDVTLGGSPVFTFASANVGTGITLNTTGYTISGTDSGNYTLTQPTLSANITAKELTITGISGDNKEYDDTTAGSATGTASLSGLEVGDDVTLGGSPVFTFASANVGTGVTLNTTGYTISGTDSGNYTLTQPTLSANITAKELTITGITGDNKEYDDTTAGSATGTASLSGLEVGDDVTLGGSPVFTFASANVGTGITLNTTGYTISGTDSGNYTLTQPNLSANITAKELTITGLTGDDKPYDGTTAATASGTASLSGVEVGDDVTLGGSPVFTFASANVGTGITINTTGYTISGTDSGNYTLTQPTLSADITGPSIGFTTTSSNGLESVASANLSVDLSIASPQTVTIDYAVTAGTATGSGTDYTLTSGTLTFNPGSSSENIVASIVNEAMLESDETFIVTLTNPVNGSLGTNTSHTYTITNDDTATVTIADVSTDESETLMFTATLDNPVQGGFTVDVSTNDGTATVADSDYTAVTSQTLTFTGTTAGETQMFSVTSTDDTKVEADETFTITQGNLAVTSLSVDITDGATGTINNDDTASVTIEDVIVNEGDGATIMTLTLDNDVQGGFSVDVSALDGTATAAGVDFAAIVGQTETFAGTAGETQTVIVAIGDDLIGEETEMFSISMSGLTPTSASVSDIDVTDTATITILDDDAPIVTSVVVPIAGDYKLGDFIDYVVTFSNPVNITGTPSIALTIGGATKQATLFGTVTNSTTATFRYEVESDDLDDDGIEARPTISLNGGTIKDASNNVDAIRTINNLADTPNVNVDGIIPTVSLSLFVSSPTNQPFEVQANFSELVTGFDLTDIVVTNGVASIFNQSNNPTRYTFTITPTIDGEVTVSILDNVLEDLSGNANEASNVLSVIYDQTRPVITITSDAPTDPTNASFTATFTVSEDLADFEAADVVLTNATISNFVTISPSLYTATITPIVDGIVTLEIPEDDLEDNANNGNEAASFSISYDTIKPDVLITSSAADPINAAFDITVTFSEDVTGFELADITVANGTASSLNSVSAREYTATITPITDGVITVDVFADVAQDAATNTNTVASQFSILYDGTNPTVDITSSVTDPTNTLFMVTITFSEDVTGFDVSDITVGNGTTGSFTTISATEYTAMITPTTDGDVTIDIATGVAQDAATNGNEAATQFSVLYDFTKPDVSITTTANNPTNAPFTATITFTEDVTGFEESDIVVSNATTGSFTTISVSEYTVEITPVTDGIVTLDIPADIAQDAATNTNTAASQFSIEYDATNPTVVVSSTVADPTNAPFMVTFTFSEDVIGFDAGDITVGNGTAGLLTIVSASEYTSMITPLVDGIVTVELAADVATDAATNGNIVSNQFSVLYDGTNPEVVITSTASGTTNVPFTTTITFSEDVTGFTASDIVVGNGTISSFTTVSALEYTALITPTVEGAVTVDLPTAVAQDAATNPNNVATQFSIVYDITNPTVLITSTVPDPTNAAFMVTFTFSEDVIGFDAVDITVGNGTAGVVTPVSTTVYTAMITPTADGIVTVELAAGVAQDTATNGNDASNQFSVLYDATNPTAVMSTLVPDPVNTPFTVDIVFDEDVFGFEMTDLVVTNGTPSAFSGSGSTYSVLITPTVTDNVFVDIPAAVANDLATNPNDGASFTIVYDDTPPLPPSISHISDYTCSGDVSQTSDNTLEISGTAERGSTVEVFIEGISVGTTISDINTGFFTFDHTGTVLADGTYAITAQATDIAMNTGALSNPFAITINTVDSDGDGNPDFCDDDDDGDGVDDVDQDCDNDGIIDSLDTDNSSCFAAIAQVKTYGFSPNGDGVNDGWVIEGITAYPNSLVQVFNRSGKQVFKKKGYQNDWDGISNQISNSGANGKLPVGPYLFIIDLGDGSQPTRGWLYINY